MSQKKNRIYVLDTNVLLHDPNAITAFFDRDVIIPMKVIEELDTKKNAAGEIGYNAREVARILRDLRMEGSLINGIKNDQGGTVMVVRSPSKKFMQENLGDMDTEKPDNVIIATALEIRAGRYKDIASYRNAKTAPDVILVSNDVGIQITADVCGLKTEFYRKDRLKEEDLLYTGRIRVNIGTETLIWGNNYSMENPLPADTLMELAKMDMQLIENEFIEMRHTADDTCELGIYRGGFIYPLRSLNKRPYGVTPRNAGQFFMQEALMAPVSEIPLVIIKGTAGTAKTFFALATGLERTITDRQYDNILYTRANVEFDKDIGALPGDEQDKMGPLIRPCMDNLNALLSKHGYPKKKDGITLPSLAEELFETGVIRSEAMSFMRGRSLQNTMLIVDESQNCSIGQIRGIVTRPGEGTKVVLAGDPDQIDNRFLDRYNNGLSFAAERFKGSSCCAQIVLDSTECTRSRLAMEASRLLL